MDYRITDAALDPVGVSERWNVEELVRLPAGAAAFSPPAVCPPVNDLPARANGFVTFGSFNNLAKVTPRVLEAWAAILQAVPTARLVIVGRTGSSVIADLHSLGVAADRVEMIDRLPMADYLALHHRVDLLLDTFPYNGGTTTLLAAWMGVPFITLAGGSTTGRAGAGLLNALGLPHFVADDEAAYIAAASGAARDLDSLAAWRSDARARLAPHFNDGSVFTKQLEAAFRRMWEKWCASRKSQSLAA
jgi:predicted O-linked N-acetylglucosamine transferase (SPINDLY family)